MKSLILSMFVIFSALAADQEAFDVVGKSLIQNDKLTAMVVFGVDEFSHGDEVFINARLQLADHYAKELGFKHKKYTVHGFDILFSLTYNEYLQVFGSNEDINLTTKAGESLSYDDNIKLSATGAIGNRTIKLYEDNGKFKYDYSAEIIFENNRIKTLAGKVIHYKNGIERAFKGKKSKIYFNYTLSDPFDFYQGLGTYSIDGFHGPAATTPNEMIEWIINGFEK